MFTNTPCVTDGRIEEIKKGCMRDAEHLYNDVFHHSFCILCPSVCNSLLQNISMVRNYRSIARLEDIHYSCASLPTHSLTPSNKI